MSGLFAALVDAATGEGRALSAPPRPRFAAEEPFADEGFAEEEVELPGDAAPGESRAASRSHSLVPPPARMKTPEPVSRRDVRLDPSRSEARDNAPLLPAREAPVTPARDRAAADGPPPLADASPPPRRVEAGEPAPASQHQRPDDVQREKSFEPDALPASDSPLLPRRTADEPASRTIEASRREQARAPAMSVTADTAVPEIRIGRIEVNPPAPSAAAKAAPVRAHRPSRAPVRASLDDYLSRGRR